MDFNSLSNCRLPLVLLSCLLAQSHVSAAAHKQSDFSSWRSTMEVQVSEFEKYLQTSQVSDIVPLQQLVRTATDWEVCGGPRFELPPKQHWSDVVRTLRLLKSLRSEIESVGQMEVVSAYRNPRLNKCAGGAGRSAHTRSFALDLVGSTSAASEICTFWKRRGSELQMGLSRYKSGRVHIDTAGYRSWGNDFTRKTSYCK